MPIYMKYEAIKKGESQAKGHEGDKGWIEVQSVQFGASRNIQTPVGQSSKREASAPSISEITITKVQDSTSPLLFQEAVAGKGSKVNIDFCQTQEGKLETYLELTLTNTMVSGYSVSSAGENHRPVESISLNFTKIEYKTTPFDDKHVAGTPTSTSYDLAQGAK